MIGIDIADVRRIRKAIESKSFRDRVFTAAEQRYCDGKPVPHVSYAGLFCAKEAAVKAIKRGFGKGIMPTDIEIEHDENGAPVLNARGNATSVFATYNADVSISHDGDYAVAVVMLLDRSDKL